MGRSQTVRVYFNFGFSFKDLCFLWENPAVGTTLGLELWLQTELLSMLQMVNAPF